MSSLIDLKSSLFSLFSELGGPVLALDTSHGITSVALIDVQQNILLEKFEDAEVRASDRVMSVIVAALEEASVSPASLSLIVSGVGPGSFTGIRVAMASAKGIAMAHDIPMLPISSLLTLAAGVGSGLVAPCLNARRGEVFGAIYRFDGGSVQTLLADAIFTPDIFVSSLQASLQSYGEKIHLVGDGVPFLDRASLAVKDLVISEEVRPRVAASLLALSDVVANREWQEARSLGPNYLRLSEPEIKRLATLHPA